MSGRASADLLQRWALEEGFDRAGVARLGPAITGGHFRAWLRRGNHATMAWLERRTEVRLDPGTLLEGARSALCVTLRYHPLIDQPEVGGDLWPRVARYARGEDYHQLMKRSLEALASRIQEAFPGCRTRPYVDTGPILERDLASAAGLGVVGKNTQLLHPEDGSWFLLGELLLTLELEPGAPVEDLCGSCSRCLEACPTDALYAPYQLDSRRCISYWTIEHRGPIPIEVRQGLEDWVFGCDICQEVCPLNEAPAAVRHDELRLPGKRSEVDLGGLLNLDREEYVERFRRSPMKRAKLDGLQRNAAVAIGNRRSERYLQSLERALHEADSAVVRGHAAWALGEIGGPRARRVLRDGLGSEGDPTVREEIEAALGRF